MALGGLSMHRRTVLALGLPWAAAARSGPAAVPTDGPGDLPHGAQAQVLAAERAFARAMAERDFVAFQRFLSDEAVFFTGPTPLRGKPQVAAGWARFFDGPQAPFSWAPDVVEVLASGTLALSSGPVRNPQGEVVARFNSVWRLEAPGTWRVVFDKGSPADLAARP